MTNILSADTQGFEGGVGDWTLTGYARDNSSAEAGSWSISVSVPSGAVTSQAVTPTGLSAYAVTPGDVIQLTAFHQVTGGGTLASTARIRLKFYDSSGTLTHTVDPDIYVSRSGEGFKRFGYKATAPSGAAYMSVFLSSSTAQSGTRQAYFDEIWLEQVTELGAARDVAAQIGADTGQATSQSVSGIAMPFTVSTAFDCGGIAIRHRNLSGSVYRGPSAVGLDYAAGSSAVEGDSHRAGISTRITAASGHTTSTVPWLGYDDVDASTEINVLDGWTYYLFTPVSLVPATQYSLAVVEKPGLARPAVTCHPGAASRSGAPITGPVALDGNMVLTTLSSPFVAFNATSSTLIPTVRFLGPVLGGWQVGGIAF